MHQIDLIHEASVGQYFADAKIGDHRLLISGPRSDGARQSFGLSGSIVSVVCRNAVFDR